jgi:hypothetical protein
VPFIVALLAVLGGAYFWLMGLINECGGPRLALDRLVRRLMRMRAAAAFEPLMAVLRDVAPGAGGLNDRQHETLEVIARHFQLS